MNLKFFKNKFFISILCIAVALTIFSAVFSIMGVGNTAKNFIGKICAPIESGIWKMKESLKGYSLYFSDMDSLIEENKQLQKEVDELNDKLNDSQVIKEENDRLRDYISVKDAHKDFKFTEALIIGSETDNYMSIIKINKGTDNGLKINMPVIVSTGLVGSICEVGPNWANIRVICESASSVGGYISRNGETGIVQGDITYKDKGICKLTYLDMESDIEIGDLVYTSGSGSVYPGGLFIGKVASVEIDEYTRSKVATVECAVDFNKLSYVMVITDFNSDISEGGTDE
ncbi:MAG: rod shape-determining protein MreC [Ruminococcaceae bacterium]|nr:rod shape-determining protein MreC [Oscillospiraceae bacterium]